MAAAARTLSQILIQSKKLSILSASASASTSSRFVTTRNRSSKSEGGGGSLIEVNLETDGENEIVGMRRLEDAIYGIIVRRSAPDWLPFSPGSSYWVPPKKRPQGFAELIGKLANPLSEDETLSLTNARGWPSTSFFIDGSASPHSLSPHIIEKEIVVDEPIAVEKKEKSKKNTKAASHPEDEEG
ncbi:hypothetical protein MKX01_036735 [Papaver californicum]|nr:hypothetical protein MKX01_036735 [Papaver californicum]